MNFIFILSNVESEKERSTSYLLIWNKSGAPTVFYKDTTHLFIKESSCMLMGISHSSIKGAFSILHSLQLMVKFATENVLPN